MNNVGERISLFHNLFSICLILALVFLILAVVLFFVLDIRSVLGELTGRRRKKGIKKIEEETARSGRLMPKERTNMQYVAQEMKDDMGVRQKAKPGIRKVEHVVEAETPITAEIPVAQTHQVPPVEQGTALLQEQGTAVLRDSGAGQENNYVNSDGSTGVLETNTAAMGNFTIVREIVFIHTEEVI